MQISLLRVENHSITTVRALLLSPAPIPLVMLWIQLALLSLCFCLATTATTYPQDLARKPSFLCDFHFFTFFGFFLGLEV